MFTVTHPKAGDIDFPDGTTDDDIAKAMRQLDAETASPSSSQPQPGRGMGDLRMAESQPQTPGVNPFGEELGNYDLKAAGRMAMKPVKFLGDAATAASTGPINAIAQGIQDRAPSQIPKNLVKSTLNPVANLIGRPFQNPVQGTERTYERMGVPNKPTMDTTDRTGEELGNYYNPGTAKVLGAVTDMFTPAVALGAVKPIAKAVEYGAREISPTIGRGLQSVAIRQAKSAIPINIPFARKGAESETFLKENLLSGGKDKAYEKSADLSKKLGNEVVGIIEQGKNEGKTVDGLALIDNLKSKFKNGPIETKEGIRILEPASQKFLDKAEKLIKRMSQDGDGRLSVKQAHAVKQWAQKQADYPGKALAQGLPLTAEADAAGLTAADLGYQFRTAVESKVPEVKDLNARLAKIIPAKQAAGWKQAVRERQELVPLKAFVAVAADLAASKGAAVGLLAMNTAWKSGRISQAMYNLGSKLIKAGNVAEKTKIEKAMEAAVSKGIITSDELGILQSQIDEGKKPFISSIVTEGELAPRSTKGRVAFDKPETFVPQIGSYESPFGKPKPEAPAQFDPLEAMSPRNRRELPQGQGSLDDMAPTEMRRSQQQAGQDSREAFVRQGRGRALDIPPKPTDLSNETPGVRMIPEPKPNAVDPEKIKALKKMMAKAQTKAEKKAIMKLILDESFQIPANSL